MALAIVTLSGGAAAGLAAGFASPASAVSGTALINADTVTGSPSVEQTIAASQGLSVTVVSGSTWDSMTAADFASYSVLIVGDPTCGALAPSVTSNSATWTSAVMATAGGNTAVGNRVVWGADPVRADTPGADKGISDGIAFASAFAPTTGHATGVYFDTSCGASNGNNALLVNTLNQLSVGTTRPWTEDASPACNDSVSVTATAPQFSDLATSDFAGWQCAARETFPTFETDFVPIAIDTGSSNASACGTDTTTGATTCGEAYYLAAGSGLSSIAADITVSPLTGSSLINHTHTITATLTNGPGGSPIVGLLVTFTVSGANAGASGTCSPADCESDAAGKVAFTYTGINPGNDTIVVSITCDGAILTATAAMTWTTTPTTTPATTTPTTPPPPPPPPPVPPKIFQVELRSCTHLHVGYNRFPAGIVVHWKVTQHASSSSTGTFTTLGGGKTNHFVTPKLAVTLHSTPKGTIHFTWAVNGTPFTYTAARGAGC